jgi:hypothetical protein
MLGCSDDRAVVGPVNQPILTGLGAISCPAKSCSDFPSKEIFAMGV